jgi:CarboxypepD_reg-like domain/Gram-negative bacterial TonB protein C-terminal
MSRIEPKYERIIKYLKGFLSNRERHDLEKEMMQDAFEEDAFEGLTRISGEELETDMELLGKKLNDRMKTDRERSLGVFFRIAAGIILVAGIAGILYVVINMPSKSLLTEETGKMIRKAPPEVLKPSAMDTLFPAKEKSEERIKPAQSNTVVGEKPVLHKNESGKIEMTETVTENAASETVQEEAIAERKTVSEGKMAEKEKGQEEVQAPVVSRRKSEAAAPSAIERAGAVLAKAKVVDIQGNPLPGVTILEKGSTHGTVTGMDGMFSLQAFDTGSVLELSYIGYSPVEMKAKDAAGKEISMNEDLMALDEVVVVGYGVQKKSDLTGAVAGVSVEEISPSGQAEGNGYVNPIPPGGSAKAFKKWVYERLDPSILNLYTEKQKILVNVTVQADGSVSDIRIKGNVPEPLAEEIRRIISQSPRWDPARKDNLPVVTKVAIRFVIGAE